MSANSVPPKFKIGITQIISHPGIDLVRKGFLDGMKAHGIVEGKNVTYDIQNAQGQMAVASTIARKFVADRVDLIFSITTPSTQTVVKAAKGSSIPVVFGAVTDPVTAGIVKSFDPPNDNVTGTSDIIPVKAQLELLKQVAPKVKKIGVIFDPGESNAYFIMKLTEKAAKELGLTLVLAPVSNTSEVMPAAQSLVGRCQALYSGASNTVAGAIEGVIKVSENNKLPLLVAASSSVAKGGFGSVGFDYYDVGKKSADLAAQILLQGKKAGNIPVAKITEYKYFFNLKSAKASGIIIPKTLLKKAAEVYK
jgi:putative ABC transport system substrate-binding protein